METVGSGDLPASLELAANMSDMFTHLAASAVRYSHHFSHGLSTPPPLLCGGLSTTENVYSPPPMSNSPFRRIEQNEWEEGGNQAGEVVQAGRIQEQKKKQ